MVTSFTRRMVLENGRRQKGGRLAAAGRSASASRREGRALPIAAGRRARPGNTGGGRAGMARAAPLAAWRRAAGPEGRRVSGGHAETRPARDLRVRQADVTAS